MDAKHKGSKPKLDRRNAIKNIDYDAATSSSSSSSSFGEQSPNLRSRSLDISPLSDNRTSFRIKGVDGEFDLICRSLGFSGPEDFAIPTAVWEAQKARSASDISARLLKEFNSPKVDPDVLLNDVVSASTSTSAQFQAKVRVSSSSSSSKFKPEFESSKLKNDTGRKVRVCDDGFVGPSNGEIKDDVIKRELKNGLIGVGPPVKKGGGGGVKIKGERPPVLAPPPVKLPPVVDNVSSTWDILKSFAPQEDEKDLVSPVQVGFIGHSEKKEVRVSAKNEVVIEEKLNGVRLGETDYVSPTFTTTFDDNDNDNDNDDDGDDDGDDGGDVFNVIMEPVYSISPHGKFRLTISSWQKGGLLGSGSFGTVFEGFTDDGFFFAVKEVSLLDQGSQAKQSIFQLEQEISLLSQFEHENIVRYLGTDKDDAKLYIFLELVTKGSLASLYQKYNLRDSQVSSYTRQILSGLTYLHDRNVVHRDIKCANILVDASGSVKLADFGLAKATNMNDVKSCKGTAFWMAPEVVNLRNRGYGLAADIWSLGCTVLEMLTRRPPYSHLEGMQALFRIGRGEPPSIPNSLSSDARDFILKCIQVNPNDRPTAAQLLEHPFVKRPLATPSPSSLPSPRYHSMRS